MQAINVMASVMEFLTSFRAVDLICPTFADGVQGQMLRDMFEEILSENWADINWNNPPINWNSFDPSLTRKQIF